MPLTEPRLTYKPFEYPWAYDAWLAQQQMHWIPQEIPMADDVKDWLTTLKPNEKNLLTQIFRFFTQADVEVHDCYMTKYAGVFKVPEIVMMLTSFANMETVHIAAYSHLLDTVGMPEIEYGAFLKYSQMKDKCDYLHTFDVDTDENIASTLAVFGAFTEGLALFASFAILLNFPRFNKMKGMGQIVTWSMRDETLHINSIIKLFHTFMKEKNLWSNKMSSRIRDIAVDMVEHEDAFIDLAFEFGCVEGLSPEEVKQYIRYMADRRLKQLGLKPCYGSEGKPITNPLGWLDGIINDPENSNFFESRVTEYARGATKDTWNDVF
ncbi:MAG: ribonucleotide-diphosphate reductase subunit beta [Anaplasmataceae bacterium]|nr:ribonucleotide-diphosphate reductase subunit beta [Candidatus Heimdallarchaeota archaeon]MDH5796055.1 ribonucleotide-diphosphate reductase subunit beta [Anaplasmataceae bacterium]